MRKIFTQIVVVLVLASIASAHICMWSPRQRGRLSITTPGDPSCYRPYPVDQCGNSPVELPQTKYKGGSVATLHFQQNLNHWTNANPGHFDAFISTNSVQNLTETDFTYKFGSISDYPAMDMVTQTNFTITGTIPNILCPHCVLRLRYVSNNPDEVNNRHGNNPHATFYQCADISIYPN
jgi:hypothetical protein